MARIAYDLLDEKTVEKANSVLRNLKDFTTLEKDYPLVECATFADVIKGTGWDDQSEWHYVDTPFFDEGYSVEINNQYENVTWALVSFH